MKKVHPSLFLLVLIGLFSLVMCRGAEAKSEVCKIEMVRPLISWVTLTVDANCIPQERVEVLIATDSIGGEPTIVPGPFNWVAYGENQLRTIVQLRFIPYAAFAVVGTESSLELLAFGQFGLPIPEIADVEFFPLAVTQQPEYVNLFDVEAPNELFVLGRLEAAAGIQGTQIELLRGPFDWQSIDIGQATTLDFSMQPERVVVGIASYNLFQNQLLIGIGSWEREMPVKVFLPFVIN